MPYVTSIERIAERRGRELGHSTGLQEGRTALLRRQLGRKFGALPDWAEARLAQATDEELLLWADRILDAGSLAEVMQR